MAQPYRYQPVKIAPSLHHHGECQHKKPECIVPARLAVRQNSKMARGDVLIDGEKLHRIRESMLLTQGQFADKIGTSVNWVRDAERQGSRKVLRKILGDVADALQMNPHDLILYQAKAHAEAEREPGSQSALAEDDMTFTPVRMRLVPFFEFRMSASGWSDGCEGRTADEADGMIEIPADAPPDAFAFRIRGDCMEPTFPDGAIVVCVPVRPGERGASFEPGKAYYFQRTGQQCTFKKVFFEPENGRYRLQSINPKYEPMYVPQQELQRMSRAIKIVIDLA